MGPGVVIHLISALLMQRLRQADLSSSETSQVYIVKVYLKINKHKNLKNRCTFWDEYYDYFSDKIFKINNEPQKCKTENTKRRLSALPAALDSLKVNLLCNTTR